MSIVDALRSSIAFASVLLPRLPAEAGAGRLKKNILMQGFFCKVIFSKTLGASLGTVNRPVVKKYILELEIYK